MPFSLFISFLPSLGEKDLVAWWQACCVWQSRERNGCGANGKFSSQISIFCVLSLLTKRFSKVEKNPTDGRDKPNKDVVIVDCGGEEVKRIFSSKVSQLSPNNFRLPNHLQWQRRMLQSDAEKNYPCFMVKTLDTFTHVLWVMRRRGRSAVKWYLKPGHHH